MVHTIDHMSNKVANQITAAAKVSSLCGPLQHSFMYLYIFADICVMDVKPATIKVKKEFLEELIVQYNIFIMTEPLSQFISELWCSDNNCKMCGCSVHHVFIRWLWRKYKLFTAMRRKPYEQNIVALPFKVT